MKKYGLLHLMLFLIPFVSAYANSEVIFTVDMTGETLEENAVVGIRGSQAPLSWAETTLMADPEGDGIYEVRLTFSEVPDHRMVFYKFVIDQSDLTDDQLNWEFDRYGEDGNRGVRLNRNVQYAPPAIFSRFDDRQRWMISEGHALWTLGDELMLLSEQEMTPEELGRHWAEELDWDWVTNPPTLFFTIDWHQSSSPLLDRKLIKLEPDEVQFRTNHPVQELTALWGVSEDSVIQPEAIEKVFDSMYSEIAKSKGMTYTIEEYGDNRIITIKMAE